MKVIFVIDSSLIRIRMKADWGFPQLPRVGEFISPRIILHQKDFSYHKMTNYLTSEGEDDFKKYCFVENNLEAQFREWIYDVISESCVIRSIQYFPDPENDKNIIPEILVGD